MPSASIPVDGGLPSDQPSDWPSLAQVREYVKQVRQALDEGLAAATLEDQDGHSPSQLLNVAIEHRLMHAETLAYMLHQLPFDQKVRKPRLPELVVRPVEPRMIEIPAGHATLGLPRCQYEPVSAGTTSTKHTPLQCPPSPSINTKLPTASISNS